MKTFLETNIGKTKSFILYGNLKDQIWCPDLMPRDLEHYLVKVLKGCGYEHVVFYGEAGTKGAYCLDEKSARFFFPVNKKIPLPGVMAEELKNLKQEEEGEEVEQGGNLEDEFMEFMEIEESEEYMPGGMPEEELEPLKNTDEEPKEKKGSLRIRYASRGMTLNEFAKIIHPLMLKKESHMAVVFYNMSTTDISNSNLRDDILDIWEKNSKGNICLMLLPETQDNPDALQQRVLEYRLESKFLQKIPNSNEHIPHPLCCIRIGHPNEDEVKNMLRYLSIVGTEKGNKIRFDYNELTNLAQRIQYASGAKAGESGTSPALMKEYMSEIYYRLANYVDANVSEKKALSLKPNDIDHIWGIKSEKETALEKLNKKGWEPAYDKVKEVLQVAEKTRARMQKQSKGNGTKKKQKADWGVQRIEGFREEKGEIRSKIPNFVLLGNPGTGKTTIARIIGKVLHEAGILKIGHCVETTKKDLTSSYRAGVPQATMGKVEEAEEGVLFIDEAHALGREDGGANDVGTGVEVVSTLNAAMTSPNHHFSLVIAGYEEEMEATLKLDQGFKSRFGNNTIVLKDYSPELLTTILMEELRNRGYMLDENLTEESRIADTSYVPIRCMVNRIYGERDRKRFGNARVMMDLAEYAEGKSELGVITKDCFYGGVDGKIDKEWFEPRDIGAGMEYILEELDKNFVGMNEVKEQIRTIGLRLEANKARGKSAEEIELRPIILVGNPGTGKSSLAELLPKLYFHYGLLGSSKPIVIHASELADRYVGGSQEKILEKIREAQDVKGFLFVDEAHELLNEHFDGKGAFKAFMAPTTDKKKPFLACFAVYENKLEEFLKIDPGAKSRFQIIRLRDYNAEELFAIMKKMVADSGNQTTEETDRLLKQVFERVELTKLEDTGNARKVKRILEEMEGVRLQRCAAQGIPFDSPESFVFVPEDIPEELRKNLTAKDTDSKIEKLLKLSRRIKTERVGAEELKQELLKIVQTLIYNEKFPKRKGVNLVEPGHYFFKGNPGTGKTTGVKFFAKYLHELGVIDDPEPIFISASNLVGQYLGQTGVKTREQLENSVGRVLMIDEAYALADVEGHADIYKHDAVNEIINFLDNETYRRCTCVVFGGYERDMNALYKMNAGFKSRVHEVNFADFTLEQSVEVLKAMLDAEGITLPEDAEKLCASQIQEMQSMREFANGRTIRRYSELLCQMLEQRCIQNVTEYEEDDPRAYEIQSEDVPEMHVVLKELNISK